MTEDANDRMDANPEAPQETQDPAEDAREGEAPAPQATSAAQTPEGDAGPPEPQEDPEDLFDLMGSSGEQFKKPKKQAPPAAAVAATATKPQKKPEPKKYPRVPVRYPLLNQTIELPREQMTEDEIHAHLAMEWPELSKEQARLVYDEKAQPEYIFVMPRGHTKGAAAATRRVAAEQGATAHTPPLAVLREPPENPSLSPVFRLLASDGVYEVRNTVAGGFVVKLDAELELREGFYLSSPKPPASLLAEVVEAFRACADEEALVNVMYERASGRHLLVWPEQSREYATVSAEYTPESPERFVVCQIHSHGRMGAFFSQTDDRDELRTGLYGVIGALGSATPEAVFRYSCGGTYRPVAAAEVFAEGYPGEIREWVRAV